MSAAPGQIIDYEVKDTKGHTLSKKDDISRGKFSFTSEVFDVYELCFKSKVPNSKNFTFSFPVHVDKHYLLYIFFFFHLDVRGQAQEIQVNVKKGVETKSYEGVSNLTHFTILNSLK